MLRKQGLGRYCLKVSFKSIILSKILCALSARELGLLRFLGFFVKKPYKPRFFTIPFNSLACEQRARVDGRTALRLRDGILRRTTGLTDDDDSEPCHH